MKEKLELWLQNPGTSDISLSDLGVKVPAGKTINVYHTNPYLTEEQIIKSKKTGSLARRLDSGIIRIVRRPTNDRPKHLDILKISNKPTMARRTKTSVVIEPDTIDGADGEKFDFADYGINEISEKVVRPVKEKDFVLVNAKQDEEIEKLIQPKNTKEIVENIQNKAVNPIGPLANIVIPPNTQTIVVKEQKTEQQEQTKAPVAVAQPTSSPEKSHTEEANKTSNGAVVVGEPKDPVRSLKSIVRGADTKEFLFDDDIYGADSVIKEESEDGMRIATKTKDGVIVMTLKEEEAEPVSKPKASK